MFAAGFFDPNNNGWDITDIGAILGVVVAATGLLGLWLRWYDKRQETRIRSIVRDEVATATKPIQPGYRNGGESLADVAALVRELARRAGIEDGH